MKTPSDASVCLSVCLSVCMSVCLSVCVWKHDADEVFSQPPFYRFRLIVPPPPSLGLEGVAPEIDFPGDVISYRTCYSVTRHLWRGESMAKQLTYQVPGAWSLVPGSISQYGYIFIGTGT